MDAGGRLVNSDGTILIDPAGLNFVVTDLPDLQLSTRTLDGTVYIDTTAGDHGWHTDPSSEPVAGKVDLLSVLLHEIAIKLKVSSSADTLDLLASAMTTAQRTLLPGNLGGINMAAAFDATALAVGSNPATSISSISQTLIDRAVALWQAAGLSIVGNNTATATIATPTVVIGHLQGNEIAFTRNDGTIVIDPTAAGHGWFVDDTPADSDEFDIGGTATAGGGAAGKIDLLTVLLHEIGHAAGLGHDLTAGTADLMDVSLAAGTRFLAPSDQNVVTVDSSDQSKLNEGLNAFSGWVAELGTKIDTLFAADINLPFVNTSLKDLLGLDASAVSQLTGELGDKITSQIGSVFSTAIGPVTTAAIDALENIDYLAGSNGISFVASVDITSIDPNTTINLNLDNFAIDGGLLGLEVDSTLALQIDGGLKLEFIFGIDQAGSFYVQAPGVVAALSIMSDSNNDGTADLFNTGISLGPFSLGIVNGVIDLGASMRIGTGARLSYQNLLDKSVNPLDFIPALDASDIHYTVDLPLVLDGGFAGLSAEAVRIQAISGLPPQIGTLADVFTGLNFETNGLDNLLSFKNVSLDMVLDGLIDGLDALVQPDSIIYQKMPGLEQSLADLLGDNTGNFLENVKSAIETVRSGDLGSVEGLLNAEFKEIFGDESNPFSLTYENSAFKLDFSFEKSFEGDIAFQVDLNAFLDKIQLPEELAALGIDLTDRISLSDVNARLGVEARAGISFGIGIDLSDVSSPVTSIDSDSAAYFILHAGTLEPVDFKVSLDLGIFGEVSFAIDDATAAIDLNASYGLKPRDEAYIIDDISGADLGLSVNASAVIDMPLYFPTPDSPFGGTTADLNADGYADNVLHLGAGFADNALAWQVITPSMEDLFSLGALLNDPQNIVDGLNAVFAGLKGALDSKFSATMLPFIGDELKTAADFIDDGDNTGGTDLRDKVVGVLTGIDALGRDIYEGGIGGALLNPDNSGLTTIEIVRKELYNLLGPDGLDILKVAVRNGDGTLALDLTGSPIYRSLQNPSEVQLTISSGAIQFNLLLQDDFLNKLVPVDFSGAIPGLGLEVDADILLKLQYIMGFGFGFDARASGTNKFFFDTSGVTPGGDELEISMSATIDPEAQMTGALGLLQAELGEIDDFFAKLPLLDENGEVVTNPDGSVVFTTTDNPDYQQGEIPTGIYGRFAIDVLDPGTVALDNRLSLGEISGTPLDQLVVAELSGRADADLRADLGVDGFATMGADIHLRQSLSWSSASGAGFALPEVSFTGIYLELGTFIPDFVTPVLGSIKQVPEPMQPIVDLLNAEIPVLSDLLGPTTLLGLARQVSPADPRIKNIVRVIDAISTLVTTINSIPDDVDGRMYFGDYTVQFGADGETKRAEETDPNVDNFDFSSKLNDPKTSQSTKDFLSSNVTKRKGSLEFPLLTNPSAAINLLLGKNVDIFIYTLPSAGFQFDWSKTFQLGGPLIGKFAGSVDIGFDLSFGMDTTGLKQYIDDLKNADWNVVAADPTVLFNGFFLGDHCYYESRGDTLPTGNGIIYEMNKDNPEAWARVDIRAGVGVGIAGLVEVLVEGGASAQIELDWAEPDLIPGTTLTRTLTDGYHDGKIYFDELSARLTAPHTPFCIFDISGDLSAELGASIWVGLDLGFLGKLTLYENSWEFFDVVLADFNYHCSDEPPPSAAHVETSGTDRVLVLNMGDDWVHRADSGATMSDYPEANGRDVDTYFEVTRANVAVYDTNPESATYGKQLTNPDGSKRVRAATKVKYNTYTQYFYDDEGTITRIEGFGGDGNDTVIIDKAILVPVELHGGKGNDQFQVKGSAAARLYGDEDDDKLSGGLGRNELYGGGGNDTLLGNVGNDKLIGGDGDDNIDGAAGNDHIEGGAGNDILKGGVGDDWIFGDSGDRQCRQRPALWRGRQRHADRRDRRRHDLGRGW